MAIMLRACSKNKFVEAVVMVQLTVTEKMDFWTSRDSDRDALCL